MKPETQDYLQLARDDLEDAKKVFSISLPKLSARCAYFAAFHAAEAYIYERTDRAVKTHSGVRAEFSRLLKDLPDKDAFLSRFLAQAYEFKEIQRLRQRRERRKRSRRSQSNRRRRPLRGSCG